MRRNERGEICVPAAEQHRGAPVIHLGQTEPAVLLRNFDAERAHREKIVDVFLRDLAGPIDFIGIDVFAQIFLQTGEKFFSGGAIFGALLGKWVNARKIVTADKKVARETAAIVERIARGFGQLERFALAFRHF